MNYFKNNILQKLNKFEDIYEISKNLSNKQKGDIFEIITYFIFRLHPNYKNITKNIYLFCDIPPHLLKNLNIPDKDKGIDLVWETIDNEFYAIQCKFRSNVDIIVPWKDLSTFVGLTHGVGKFSKGIYVTNTYGLNEEIINSDKTISIYGDFFKSLPENFFNLIKSYINNTKLIYNAFTPRDYQNEIINNCEEYYEENNRGYITSACGTGKSLSCYWIDKKLQTKLSLVLVPSLHLLSQFYGDWVKQSISDGINIYYLLIGSESDFGDSEVIINGKNYNIKDQNGLITTTDLNYIKEKLEKHCKQKIVIISTYQSSDLLINLPLKIDLCIFDEAHKTVGQKDNKFSLFLNNIESVEINKRLFMTATPKIYQGVNDDIISMNDEEYYGKEIYNYSIRDAIESNYLCDYQIVTMYTDDDYISKFIENNNLINSEIIKSDSYTLMCAIMIYKGFTELGCHHMLTYHSSIKNSLEFSKLLTKLFDFFKINILVQHMDGKMNMRKRKGIERSFINSEKAIICSAQVLREGVNIPIIDSEMFVDNCKSKIDIVQRIGRGSRLHPNKNILQILVPYKCKNIDDIENDKTSLGNMISIIKSLYDYDTKIVDYFTTKDKSKSNNKNNIIRHLTYTENIEIFTPIKIEEWTVRLDLVIFNKTDSFEYMYSKVKDWVDNNHKIPSSNSKNKDEKQLGKWCDYQKECKKKEKLSQDKINKLNKLKNWYWDYDDIWNNKYKKVKLFIKQNNKLPSENSLNDEEKQLGQWCCYQKESKKKLILTQYRIDKLTRLQNWYWEQNIDDIWNTNYENIKLFINQNKRFPEINTNDKLEKKYGAWISRQKTLKKGNKLSQNKIDKLNLLNIKWRSDNKRNMTKWEDRYEDIKKFTENNNKLPSNRSKNEIEKTYGSWCAAQRVNKNKLSQDKIDKLNLIKGWYWKKYN